MDFSLSRIQDLLKRLPPYTRPTIHVAGTNGKGSVTAYLDSVLRNAGFSVGRFNSPHLLTVRDSIALDGAAVSEEVYATSLAIVEAANKGIDATSFEVLTATALYTFEQAKIDIAIVEVGLGGRLDATNAIPDQAILISAISAVDLDHQAILGNSVEEIAREKAGIGRKGAICVVGEQRYPAVYSVIREVLEDRGAIFSLASERASISTQSFPYNIRYTPSHIPPPTQIAIRMGSHNLSTTLPLQGGHQYPNVVTALAIIDHLRSKPPYNTITDAHIAQGIASTKWPGRLDWVTIPTSKSRMATVLVDGAHNAASAQALSAYLGSLSLSSPRTFVISLSHSPPKTPQSVLEPLLKPGDRVAVLPFTAVEGMPWVRPVDSETLKTVVEHLVGTDGVVRAFTEIREALEWATEMEGLAIISGSLYLIADLYRLRLEILGSEG